MLYYGCVIYEGIKAAYSYVTMQLVGFVLLFFLSYLVAVYVKKIRK